MHLLVMFLNVKKGLSDRNTKWQWCHNFTDIKNNIPPEGATFSKTGLSVTPLSYQYDIIIQRSCLCSGKCCI